MAVKEAGMKKYIATLVMLVTFSIASSAMAARVKVPKTLCLDWDSTPGFPHQLILKTMGKLPDAVEKNIKIYAITGFDFNGWNGPVSGSAYVIPGTSILHATYSGMSGGGYERNVSFYELHFDLSDDTGTLQYLIVDSDGSKDDDYDTVSSTDCKRLSITTSHVLSPANRVTGVCSESTSNAAQQE
jgi:hypothetical protein